MFPNAVLHQGALLSVAVTSDGDTFQEVLTFNNSGKDGSGAVNFSCVIYNIRFMNCSWAPGPAAPADVQYRLEVWTSLLEDGAECPQYIRDLAGTHVGCHFNILPEPKHPQYIFLLNGTSKETAIPFLDFDPFEAFKMEKYNPPSNITSHYNGSNYIIQWENPQRRFEFASHILDYQLDIQKKGSSRDPVSIFSFLRDTPLPPCRLAQQRGPNCELSSGALLRTRLPGTVPDPTHLIVREGQDRNVYLLPSSEAYGERSLRIRVRHRRSDIWSDWSETLHFSLQKQSCGNVAVILPVVGVAAATLTVLLMVIFRRSSLRQKLFLPIPQVKSFLTPNAEITWEGDHLPPDTEEPEFLIVEEME
ncbi:granulocyte-macrophage colony-stimulating factor receptor subunit alpha-like isoform X4 [Loxodonta africana]